MCFSFLEMKVLPSPNRAFLVTDILCGTCTQAIPILLDSVRFLVPVLESRTFTDFFLSSHFNLNFHGSMISNVCLSNKNIFKLGIHTPIYVLLFNTYVYVLNHLIICYVPCLIVSCRANHTTNQQTECAVSHFQIQ